MDATLSQVAAAHDFLRDAKVHQDAEASRLAEVLEVLSIENKKLQAAARNGWSQTWKLQANLRAYEDDVEQQREELAERQRRLEQENCCLRKESAGLKTRLLGWQQMQKRGSHLPAGSIKRQPASGLGGGGSCSGSSRMLPRQSAGGRPPSPPTRSTTDIATSAEASSARSPTNESSEVSLSGGRGREPMAAFSGHTDDVFLCTDEAMQAHRSAMATSSAACKSHGHDRFSDMMEDLDVQVPPQAPRGEPPGAYRQIAELSVAFGTPDAPWLMRGDSFGTSSASANAGGAYADYSQASTAAGRPPLLAGSPGRPSAELRRSQSQELGFRPLEELSPAAREAASVSASVRLRAAESLKELGLCGELRSFAADRSFSSDPGGGSNLAATQVELGSPELSLRETRPEVAGQAGEAWQRAAEEAAGQAFQQYQQSQDPHQSILKDHDHIGCFDVRATAHPLVETADEQRGHVINEELSMCYDSDAATSSNSAKEQTICPLG